MRAKPKRRFAELATIGFEDGAMWIECELMAPPSMAGRSVDVYFDPAEVTELLLDARRAAVRGRSNSEVGRVDG